MNGEVRQQHTMDAARVYWAHSGPHACVLSPAMKKKRQSMFRGAVAMHVFRARSTRTLLLLVCPEAMTRVSTVKGLTIEKQEELIVLCGVHEPSQEFLVGLYVQTKFMTPCTYLACIIKMCIDIMIFLSSNISVQNIVTLFNMHRYFISTLAN
jgi:hypothetical protein